MLIHGQSRYRNTNLVSAKPRTRPAVSCQTCPDSKFGLYEIRSSYVSTDLGRHSLGPPTSLMPYHEGSLAGDLANWVATTLMDPTVAAILSSLRVRPGYSSSICRTETDQQRSTCPECSAGYLGGELA